MSYPTYANYAPYVVLFRENWAHPARILRTFEFPARILKALTGAPSWSTNSANSCSTPGPVRCGSPRAAPGCGRSRAPRSSTCWIMPDGSWQLNKLLQDGASINAVGIFRGEPVYDVSFSKTAVPNSAAPTTSR